MQKTLTSLGVAAIVAELKDALMYARIQNVYQIKTKAIALKIHQRNQPPLNLLVEAGRRLHLTSYVLQKPKRPSAFSMALRKYIRNGIISEIRQHEFERVVTIKAERKNSESLLVLELFGEGNIILVDSEGIIQQAMTFKRMRDRNILRGERFQQAPPSGKNPLSFDAPMLPELKKFRNIEVVKALTKLFSIGGVYAEEILLRAQVNKNEMCEELNDDEADRISGALAGILTSLQTRSFQPGIVLDEQGQRVDVTPIQLKKYEGLHQEKFQSFNEALDEFCARNAVRQEMATVAKDLEQEIAKQRRILRKQQISLEEEKEKASQYRRIGNCIYTNLHLLQTFLLEIRSKKKSGMTWAEIISKIEDRKANGDIPFAHFASLDTKRLLLNLSFEDLAFSINLRHSVQENAATYFNRAKRGEKKARGAEKAIGETLNRIEAVQHTEKIEVKRADKPLVRRRRKAWYERFRWFHTSENLLVVSGKDAVSNDVLIKKHMEPHDLVFHADIVGAPFVLIKTAGETPSAQSITEAAQYAASHSRAWRARFSTIDVYWVHPNQLSKTPPSGEFLPRGSFIIQGKKHFLRNTPLRLAVGVDTKASSLSVVGGPRESVKNQASVYAEIGPGDLPSRKLASRIRQILTRRAPKESRAQVSEISLDEIQIFIPYGKGTLMDR
jgi:predicted ribosome quality control (RQC) complex YloA/Tae2 family protein